MSEVCLVSVVHDPDGGLMATMAGALPGLLAAHAAAYVVVSERTSREVADRLRRLDMHVAHETIPGVGSSRRQALGMAAEAGHRWFHYCDFDRALHWARDYPGELAATLALVSQSDMLVIGRTPRAFASHPRCMIDTERLANRVFALRHGLEWDLCGAARGLSAQAAEVLLAKSRVRGVGTEAEWPALLREAAPSLRLDYVEVEGMEYETADRFPGEVAAAGGLVAWGEALSRRPEQWERRLAYATAIARAALHPGEEDAPVHAAE